MAPAPTPSRTAPRGPAVASTVLDTAALLAGLGPAQGGTGHRWVIPPSVQAEVRPGGATGRSLERALAAGLEVRGPSPEARARVAKALEETGETRRLSAADRDVVALALDLAAMGAVDIWTDDYSVQNTAKRLGIATRPVLTEGITEEAVWHVRCTGCARFLDEDPRDGVCPVCGSPVKRTRKAPPR